MKLILNRIALRLLFKYFVLQILDTVCTDLTFKNSLDCLFQKEYN